jgi:hypothetical protein
MSYRPTPSAKRETGLWLAGVLLLLSVTFAVVPAKYHLAGDLMVYRVAQTTYESGGNPYSQRDLRSAQLASVGIDAPPGPVWNPPIFFVTIGPLLNIAPIVISVVLPTILLCAALGLCWIGWRTADLNETFPGLLLVGTVACSLPWWTNLLYGQWSMLHAALVALGIRSFIGRRDVAAGVLLSVVVLKPHPYWLLLLLVGAFAVRERRGNFMLSLVSAVSVLSLLAEVAFPAIHWLWVYRESWPARYLTATFPSFLRMIWKYFDGPPSSREYLGIVVTSLLFGTALFSLIVRRSGARKIGDLLPLSLPVSVLFAPYGFVFDQGILILFQVFILAKAKKAGTDHFTRVFHVLVGMNLLTALGFLENPWNLWLEWCLLPVLLVSFQLFAPRSWVTVEPSDRRCCPPTTC